MGRWSTRLADARIAFTGLEPGERPVGDSISRLSPDQFDRLTAAVRRADLAAGADGPCSMMATAWAARSVAP
jgi:hypothetical protein